MTRHENTRIMTEAFEQMYISNFHKIKSFCFGYLKDDATAESISQDVFVAAWDNRNNLEFSNELLPYLFVVAKNKCLNEIKRNKLKKIHSVYFHGKSKEDVFYASLKAVQLDLLYSKDLESELNKIIKKLPETVKSTFRLSRAGNKKYEEIAKIENISVKTVEYRIMFALRELRKALEKHLVKLFFLGLMLSKLLYE